MTNPDQEFFQFLTEEDNLKGLIVAKNQFPIVRDKLIADFWNSVKNKIVIALNEHPNWEVVLEPNITKWYSKLYVKEKDKQTKIYNNQLPSYIFCFQRLNQSYPYFGFWINEEIDEFKKNEVKNYIESIHQNHFAELKGFESWWLIWDEIKDFDLSNDETLFQILPDKVDDKAQDFADRLIDLFERVLPHLLVINERFKIQKP